MVTAKPVPNSKPVTMVMPMRVAVAMQIVPKSVPVPPVETVSNVLNSKLVMTETRPTAMDAPMIVAVWIIFAAMA